MALAAPEAEYLTLLKPEGSLLETAVLIASCTLEDPLEVLRAEAFKGTLPQGAGVAWGGGGVEGALGVRQLHCGCCFRNPGCHP
jgi:hypothetical protein